MTRREGIRRHREVEDIESIILAIKARPALAALGMDDATLGRVAATIAFGLDRRVRPSDLAEFAAGIRARMAK